MIHEIFTGCLYSHFSYTIGQTPLQLRQIFASDFRNKMGYKYLVKKCMIFKVKMMTNYY